MAHFSCFKLPHPVLRIARPQYLTQRLLLPSPFQHLLFSTKRKSKKPLEDKDIKDEAAQMASDWLNKKRRSGSHSKQEAKKKEGEAGVNEEDMKREMNEEERREYEENFKDFDAEKFHEEIKKVLEDAGGTDKQKALAEEKDGELYIRALDHIVNLSIFFFNYKSNMHFFFDIANSLLKKWRKHTKL